MIDTAHGYCLTYPAEYKVEKPNPDSTLLVIGGLLDASNPRVEIRVEDAGAGGLEAAVSRTEADYSGFPFERSEATVGGAPAVVLDGLPGQEITRRVLFVHEGRLYTLDFAPADPAADAFDPHGSALRGRARLVHAAPARRTAGRGPDGRQRLSGAHVDRRSS